MKRKLILLCLLLVTQVVLASGKLKKAPSFAWQEGDIVFQSLPHGALVDAIEGSTASPYSHCGIVTFVKGKPFVLEAIGPVKLTEMSAWIGQGREHAFDVYRFHGELGSAVPKIIRAAYGYLGRPYDIRYDLDDGKIYCSELIWKAVRDATGKQIGTLKRLGELKWKPHEAVIREMEGGELPLARLMITPRHLAEAAELKQVFRSL
jgi:uncharacterized protein YycO